jgi:hypothetical protein
VYEFYSSSPITGFVLAGYIGTILYIPGVPELPHDILRAYSGVKIKTKIERKNVEGPIVSIP